MTQPLDRTRPTSPIDQFQYAIYLAKAGRKVEAREALRRVVALQPVNQAAWLWLSALATELAEAEAALAQARRINPLHPNLAQAEQWITHRFAAPPVHKIPTLPMPDPTKPTKVATLPAPAELHQVSNLPMSPQPANSASKIVHLIVLAAIALVAVIGLGALLLGLTLPVKATTSPQATAVPLTDSALQERPAALDEAWASRDWIRAIAILEGLRQIQPTAKPIIAQLTHAYLQQGIALRHKGFVEEAQPYFEQALDLTPDQRRTQQEKHLAADYLAGIEFYQAGAWGNAIEMLEKVRAKDSNYAHIKDLLYSAYYNQGLALQAAGKMTQARDSLAAAVALRPDLPESRRQMAEIEFALAPQTLPSTPIPPASAKDKLIVVGIAEQRMWVFERDKKVFDFIVSTGEPGSDTAIGDFEILNKIDVAYGGNWNLDMPYWLGIYWAGSLQNGIHSLPIVRHTGYKLWDGYLGQRVSYGCVILSDEDAATLYKWADVGVKVKIVWSLADWSPK